MSGTSPYRAQMSITGLSPNAKIKLYYWKLNKLLLCKQSKLDVVKFSAFDPDPHGSACLCPVWICIFHEHFG